MLLIATLRVLQHDIKFALRKSTTSKSKCSLSGTITRFFDEVLVTALGVTSTFIAIMELINYFIKFFCAHAMCFDAKLRIYTRQRS